MQAEAKSRKTQDIYAKLDRQEARRKRWRWLKNFVGHVKGLVSLIVYLVVIGAVCFAGWQYGIPYLRDNVINRQSTAPAPAATAPAPATTAPPSSTPTQPGPASGH
jgi:hypothetical protein